MEKLINFKPVTRVSPCAICQRKPAQEGFTVYVLHFGQACEFHYKTEEVLRLGIVLKDAIATTLALLR